MKSNSHLSVPEPPKDFTSKKKLSMAAAIRALMIAPYWLFGRESGGHGI